jgi:hypothetical protein
VIPVAATTREEECNDPLSDFSDLLSSLDNDSSKLLENDYYSKAQVEDLILSVPRNLHWEKEKRNQQQLKQNEAIAAVPLGILEEEDDDEEEKAEEGLEIAWQYRKSVQQERLSSSEKAVSSNSNIFCQSYDLSGRMKDQAPIDPSNYMVAMNLKQNGNNHHARGMSLFCELVTMIKKKVWNA